MTPKAKPVKAKALSRKVRTWLEDVANASDPKEWLRVERRHARAILAALKHERAEGREEGAEFVRALEGES